MPTDTTPASRALARLDQITRADIGDDQTWVYGMGDNGLVSVPGPALLALCRAAVARAEAWELAHRLDGDAKTSREADAAWGAWWGLDDAFDAATDALIAALAGEEVDDAR